MNEPGRIGRACIVAVVVVLGVSPSSACVGDACMNIWSTAEGGGALTVRFNFACKIQTYDSGFCAEDGTDCLFSAIDPGFMAPPEAAPSDGLHRLVDGTRVSVRLIAVSSDDLSLSVNNQPLAPMGAPALLGTMPAIHNHPLWQIAAASATAFADYRLSYQVTTDSPLYSDSAVYEVVVTNAPSCPGDCCGDRFVTIDDLLLAVSMALGLAPTSVCLACDTNNDGDVTVNEIVGAVKMALEGCPRVSSPFADIQRTIFTPRCATAFCHDTQSRTGNLSLAAGEAYTELVGVGPDLPTARQAGLLRVSAGDPAHSFLLLKVQGPPPILGSRMPLTGPPLSAGDVELIRTWILEGAGE